MEPVPVLYYLILGLLVYGINVMPAFMPPTWSILVYSYLRYGLSAPGTVAVGIVAATAGRMTLAALSRTKLRPIVPKTMRHNYEALGNWIGNRSRKVALPLLILFYAFFPLPSNQTFVAAGLANIDTRLMGISFMLGRLISYSSWVGLSYKIRGDLEGIFVSHLENPRTYIIEGIGLVAIFALGSFSWESLIKRKGKKK